MDAEEAQKQLTHYNFKEAELSDKNKLVVKKTEMCRRFRRGVSVHGRTSHFLHSSTLLPNPYRLKEDKQAWSQVGKLRYSSPESKRMRTSAAAPSDGCCYAEQWIMQTSAATNASTSTVATKNEPSCPVKLIFKNNDLQRISGIYAEQTGWTSE
ncbi:hypothetical protein JHK82_041056 [Glycine max]|uniref:Uncharacterized protein n=2 Tax=Glycine subgen. Soja TaxID=1462606 RepID=K7M8V3_SOYBN|nr:uncharacterized protein LOC102665231 [Glycine max]XP_014623023.1 uncharacterized protein LOC102665231 [Glycine max]XP_028203780.1 uncharacterized protein LOC114387780 [Glycine soja]XP_028203781.1 uncharacterized protein LOC114387780 [Glycine soja]XP_028203782.1 uncharacterized protein LOC114387780 [Glycine soja]KAG4380749.1 hypothetical protein GLYMA_15G010200v4 [Glycine max]KAG4955348.1 hypothetical protein JHK85_041728 [Glycine max]KAG5104086.1 hypothetical protein JHK82_041056 [Glycine|eukprot:XP_014623022.1 uncharacterized protein LOC102665231 [Glycine max]